MKNNKKMFFLTETLLAVMVIAVAFIMVRERNGKEQDKISVIIQDSEDTQWAAFQYGLKMAAEDMDVRMFIVSTGSTLTVEEEKSLIEREIDNGADAVIVQPVPGSEEMLWKMGNRVPVMLIGNAASEEGEESLLPAVSYTHLDVYKRQGLYIAIILIFIGLCIATPIVKHVPLLTSNNILNILQQASPRIFLALGVAGLILLTLSLIHI